jgi:hypothetical protein
MQSLQPNENALGDLWKEINKGILGRQGDEMKRRIFEAG